MKLLCTPEDITRRETIMETMKGLQGLYATPLPMCGKCPRAETCLVSNERFLTVLFP